MEIVIRPAEERDLPAMLRLWREMMDFHARWDARFRPGRAPDAEDAWTKYLRQEIWGSDKWCALVAEQNGDVVGQIMGVLRNPVPVFEPGTYGYVTDIVVDPQVRRRGVGKALFQSLEAWFLERGASHLELQVLEHNPASQAFWRAMGCTDFSDNMWYDLEER